VSEEMNLDEIEALLAEPDPVKKTRTPRVNTDDRTIQGWFRLQHTSSRDCEVSLHDDLTDRPRNKGMTVVIGDVAVCRICFLASADKHD